MVPGKPPGGRRKAASGRQTAAGAIHPFDREHGVETGGLIPASELVTGHANDRHVTAYYGVAPSILRSLIERWLGLRPAYSIEHVTFVDIGAGKGRALLVASEYPFKAVLGIELNPRLAAQAAKNLRHWIATQPHLAPPMLMEGDAVEFYFPPGPCLLCLFHPFEAPVLRKLLRRIETQFAGRPGTCDLLYVNSECLPVFESNRAFTRLFLGSVPMSPEDHAADLAAIAEQKTYSSTGDEECAIYRYTGRGTAAPESTRTTG